MAAAIARTKKQELSGAAIETNGWDPLFPFNFQWLSAPSACATRPVKQTGKKKKKRAQMK